MITTNLRVAKEIIKELFPIGRPVIALGSPGIGKTAIFRHAAKELGIACKVTEASSLDPTDTRGIPYVVGDQSMYGRPTLLPRKEDGEKGLLVVDELASCPPAVQVSLYPLYLERRCGDHRLPDQWVPMGTGNYTTDSAVAYNLSTALTDRAYVINIEPDLKVWKEDFAIPSGIAQAIISFLNYRPELFYTFHKRDKTAKGKAFASPRSYELASDVLKTKLRGEALLAVLAGCLSEGVATELVAFIEDYENLPIIETIYRGRDEVPPVTKPSVLYALSGALVGFLGNLPGDLPKAVAVARLVEYSMKLPAEFAILAIKDAMVQHKSDITAAPSWKKWVDTYREVAL